MQPNDDETRPATMPLLASFLVDRLYGRYSYDLKIPRNADGPGNLALLHGDNGRGKTSLLRLLWHALSPADNRGHRTALARIPFRALSIRLSNGTQISILKKDGLLGAYDFAVERPTGPDLKCTFAVNDSGAVPRPQPLYPELEVPDYPDLSEKWSALLPLLTQSSKAAAQAEQRRAEVHQFLKELRATPIFLADDRRLYSDDPELDRLRDLMLAHETRERPRPAPGASDMVAHELRITMQRLNEWLRTLTLRGQNVGSAGANSIYRDVLQRLAATGQGPAEAESTEGNGSSATRLLADLKVRSPRFERYDLIPHFDAAEFEMLLARVEGERSRVAHDILIPYLNSLSARCDALEEAEHRLTALLSATNEFLIDKRMAFSARREGLRIVTDEDQKLDPLELSSGERQLAMLFCTTLLATRDCRLFLIDEPELSLSVPWQRRVIESLLSLAAGSALQFVVATHSIEIVSSQLDSLVPLSR